MATDDRDLEGSGIRAPQVFPSVTFSLSSPFQHSNRKSNALWMRTPILTALFFGLVAACDPTSGNEPVETDAPETQTDLQETETQETPWDPTQAEARSESTQNVSPEISDEDYATYLEGMNSFGLKLFQYFSKENTNTIVSGTSVAVALGMLYAGAEDNTKAQMKQAMEIALPDDAYHAAANRLLLDLESRNVDGDKPLHLRFANALFSQRDYSVEKPFLDTLGTHYDAGVKLMDFFDEPEASRNTINEWVEKKTENQITELLPEGSIADSTRLVMTNALYFNGNWSTPFSPEDTVDAPFYTLSGETVTVPMMHVKNTPIIYTENDGYQAVNLPYGHDFEISMCIVLPDEGRFEDIRGRLDEERLNDACPFISMSNLREYSVAIPRFRFAFGTASLKDPLKELGMTDAFGSTANLGGMNRENKLYVEDVRHKAFIAVDEYGTEAAAATSVTLTLSVIGGPIVADRPFLFFIKDATGAVLFSGQVMDPTN